MDWKALRKSLLKTGCVRQEHPECPYHVTEAQAFAYLSKRIAESKETISELLSLKADCESSQRSCEKHWLKDCYECSPISRINVALLKERKTMAGLRFRLMSLPTVAEALGRHPTDSIIDAIMAEVSQPSAPTERIYGGLKVGNPTQRQRRSDVDDNIRLLKAWLREKEVSK